MVIKIQGKRKLSFLLTNSSDVFTNSFHKQFTEIFLSLSNSKENKLLISPKNIFFCRLRDIITDFCKFGIQGW